MLQGPLERDGRAGGKSSTCESDALERGRLGVRPRSSNALEAGKHTEQHNPGHHTALTQLLNALRPKTTESRILPPRFLRVWLQMAGPG